MNGAARNVFAVGQNRVNLRTLGGGTLGGVVGLAFGTLQRNLWHETGNRGDDAGHGITVPVDLSREASNGGTSFYFGNENNQVPDTTAGNAAFEAGNKNGGNSEAKNVNFPGGAHGSLVSKEFSLEGYTAADRPVVYFNYFLATENASYAPGSPYTPMRDSFRVYIAGDDGNWKLLGTNDSFESTSDTDEFDYNPNSNAFNSQYPDTGEDPFVKELYDNTNGWRQARIDLSAYAGIRNLRFRFDFTTAGSLNVGDVRTHGEELRAVRGYQLRDAQTFTLGADVYGVNAAKTFEFDLGTTLVATAGASIRSGSGFTIDDGTTTRSYLFYRTTDVPVGPAPAGTSYIIISDAMNADQVGTAIANAVLVGQGITVYRNGPQTTPTGAPTLSNRLNLFKANVDLTVAPVVGVTLPAGFIEGSAGVTGSNVRVRVHQNMTRAEVALAIRQAMALTYSGGDLSNIKGYDDLIYLIGYSLTGQSAGPNAAAARDRPGSARDRPGDARPGPAGR